MNRILEHLKTKFDSNFFWRVTSVSAQKTGVGYTLYFFSKPSNFACTPQISVLIAKHRQRGEPVSICENPDWMWPNRLTKTVTPQSFALIKEFVRLNREIVLLHWNGTIDSADLVERLVPVDKTKYDRKEM